MTGKKDSVLLLITAMLSLGSCSLFKNTTKTTTKDTRSSERVRDFNMLELTTANKQTGIFTYWDSGVVYQYQEIREKVDQAKSAAIKISEKDAAKQEVATKQSEPAVAWVYTAIGVFVIAACIWAKKG